MILSGEMRPDSKKFLRRDDSQRWRASATARTAGFRNRTQYCGFISETKHNTAASFPKQNTILRFYFKNRTQYCGFISETKHHCIQEQVF